MPARSDKFSVGVSRKIATSDEYADLTDHERSVLWTAAALLFEPLTSKRLARVLNSKVDLALARLVEQGFLKVVDGDITLAERWLSVTLSTARGRVPGPSSGCRCGAGLSVRVAGPRPTPERRQGGANASKRSNAGQEGRGATFGTWLRLNP